MPVLWLSMATFLAYVGLEIGVGQWAYTLLTASRGIAPAVAGPGVRHHWGALHCGGDTFGGFTQRV